MKSPFGALLYDSRVSVGGKSGNGVKATRIDLLTGNRAQPPHSVHGFTEPIEERIGAEGVADGAISNSSGGGEGALFASGRKTLPPTYMP